MWTGVIKSELSVQDQLLQVRKKGMNTNQNDDPEMLEEYDFSGGIRGKYIDRLASPQNVITLEPDVAEVFTDSQSVNEALRGLLPIIHKQAEKVHQQ